MVLDSPALLLSLSLLLLLLLSFVLELSSFPFPGMALFSAVGRKVGKLKAGIELLLPSVSSVRSESMACVGTSLTLDSSVGISVVAELVANVGISVCGANVGFSVSSPAKATGALVNSMGGVVYS